MRCAIRIVKVLKMMNAPTTTPIAANPSTPPTSGAGVSTAAASSCVVWIPVELVTPIASGSPCTQS